MSDSKPPSEKPRQDPTEASDAETAASAVELPDLGEASVILEHDPSGKLAAGVHAGENVFSQLFRQRPLARWQSGYAAACKAVYAGSIPTLASIDPSEPF